MHEAVVFHGRCGHQNQADLADRRPEELARQYLSPVPDVQLLVQVIRRMRLDGSDAQLPHELTQVVDPRLGNSDRRLHGEDTGEVVLENL